MGLEDNCLKRLEKTRQDIAEERMTIMDLGDRDKYDMEEYDRLGEQHDRIVEKIERIKKSRGY